MNNNFNKEITNASLDLIADDETEAIKNMQKKKWDRKKKKYVSVESTMEKSKKIKTESGNYISASYKSDLYSKWLKTNRSKVDNDRSNNNDDDNDDNDNNGHNKYGRNQSKNNNKIFFG